MTIAAAVLARYHRLFQTVHSGASTVLAARLSTPAGDKIGVFGSGPMHALYAEAYAVEKNDPVVYTSCAGGGPLVVRDPSGRTTVLDNQAESTQVLCKQGSL